MGGRTRDRAAYRPRVEGLEGRQLLAATLAPIPAASAPANLGSQVPLDGGTGTPQTYTVTSSNPDIKATIAQGKFLTINVSHASSGASDPAFTGALTFQLFDNLTPITTARIEQLVNQGYYSSKVFHRVASQFPGPNDFIVQGGSPTGNGTGSVNQPGFPFPDEFVQSLAFTNSGQLAMANSGDDTNDAQFFVTTGAPDFLDFNHTVFGQLVSGQDVLQKMTQVALNGTTPVAPITMTSAALSDTNRDGVVHIDTTGATPGETATLTVTATEPSTSTTATQHFQVNVVPETSNTRPFLGPVPATVTVAQNQPAIIKLPAVSAEAGDTLTYKVAGGVSGGTFQPVLNATATIDQATGILTVTPKAGFTGAIPLVVGVRDQMDRSGGSGLDSVSNYDTQALTLTVNSGGEVNLQPIALDTTATVPANDVGTVQLQALTGNPNSSQTLSYAIAAPPLHGVIVNINAQSGVLTYRPNPGFTGTDTLKFQVTDVGDPTPNFTSAPATLTLNVSTNATGTNHPPVALPGSTAVTAGTATPVQLTGSTGDPGTAQTLTFTLDTQPAHGTVTGFNPATGTFTYTPAAGFVGTDSVTFHVRDVGEPLPNLDSAPAVQTLTVTAQPTTNHAPTANAATLTVTPGTATPIQLTATTGDPGTAQTLTYSLVVQPSHGTITGFDPQTGKLTYTPSAGYLGADSFQFRVRDVGEPTPNLDSNVATVSLNIQEVTGDTRSVRVIGTVLVITPPPGKTPNTIAVEDTGGQYRVHVNGVLDAQQPADTNIDRLVIYGTKANDQITVDPSVTVPATLSGGLGGKNTLLGGGGPTRAHGWFGRNDLTGGSEDDALIGRAGHVRVHPSGGNDLVFLGTGGTPPRGTFYRFVGSRLVPLTTTRRVPSGPRTTNSGTATPGARRLASASTAHVGSLTPAHRTTSVGAARVGTSAQARRPGP